MKPLEPLLTGETRSEYLARVDGGKPPHAIVSYTTYKGGRRVGELTLEQAYQAASAEGIGLILAEDARIENGRIENLDYLAVRIAEAVETGIYNSFMKHLPRRAPAFR